MQYFQFKAYFYWDRKVDNLEMGNLFYIQVFLQELEQCCIKCNNYDRFLRK